MNAPPSLLNASSRAGAGATGVTAGYLAVLVADSRRRGHQGKERERLARAIARLAATISVLDQGAHGTPGASELEPKGLEAPAAWEANAKAVDYKALVVRLREIASEAVPAGSRVTVVSRGDDELLRMPGRTSTHFPTGPDGRYAGFYPADGPAALAQLRTVMRSGTQYLVIPETGRWWLDFYPEFAVFLRNECRRLVDEPGTGVVFALAIAAPESERS